MTKEPAIRVRDLVKKFGSFTANDKLTFEVHQGKFLDFSEPMVQEKHGNKNSLWTDCSYFGEVYVTGCNVAIQPEKVKKNIGYMSQRFSLYDDMTVAENIWFYAAFTEWIGNKSGDALASYCRKWESATFVIPSSGISPLDGSRNCLSGSCFSRSSAGFSRRTYRRR
jgi:ABC-type transporter Mla maintaining outer membrane lipid asymmetry ATPase subunit MlaF